MANRGSELAKGDVPKTKNRRLEIRDRWILHYLNKYKRGMIDLLDYWDAIVDVKKDLDIKSRRILSK